MLAQLRYYAKAHVAAIAAVSAWLSAALRDGHVSGTEWFGLVIALAGGGTVAAVRNGKKPAKPRPVKKV